jgi:phospholipase D1/2
MAGRQRRAPARVRRTPAGPGERSEDAKPARLLSPGENCWRVERAGRLAVIIDAAGYFAAARSAIMRAKHSVILIGWDFDLRIELEPARAATDVPDGLGQFLKWVAGKRPDLRIYVLQWDGAMVATIARQIVPMLWLELVWHRRIHFRLDSDHPWGACHHQKIVVIDDALAFCGGIDMTADRWDTRAHRDHDPCRRRPDGSAYGPFHDATVAVEGPLARALGELARERWFRASGRRLGPPPPARDLWPEGLQPLLDDVDVAIARTHPRRPGRPPVHEVEQLYRDLIAAGRSMIYCESQYLASAAIAEAVTRRLAEPAGPEVVIVNPQTEPGVLEQEAMDSARTLVLRRLRAADRHRRLAVYYPVADQGTPIYVHAKVLIVDDRLLRIGSSNLNNRSMGFDTECDLAIEAPDDPARGAQVRERIAGLRDDLLAEHLGVEPAEVAAALREHGSLIAAIEGLRRQDGRTLLPIETERLGPAERLVPDLRLLDPAYPGQAERRITHLAKRLVLAPGRALADAGRWLLDQAASRWPPGRGRDPGDAGVPTGN